MIFLIIGKCVEETTTLPKSAKQLKAIKGSSIQQENSMKINTTLWEIYTLLNILKLLFIYTNEIPWKLIQISQYTFLYLHLNHTDFLSSRETKNICIKIEMVICFPFKFKDWEREATIGKRSWNDKGDNHRSRGRVYKGMAGKCFHINKCMFINDVDEWMLNVHWQCLHE